MRSEWLRAPGSFLRNSTQSHPQPHQQRVIICATPRAAAAVARPAPLHAARSLPRSARQAPAAFACGVSAAVTRSDSSGSFRGAASCIGAASTLADAGQLTRRLGAGRAQSASVAAAAAAAPRSGQWVEVQEGQGGRRQRVTGGGERRASESTARDGAEAEQLGRGRERERAADGGSGRGGGSRGAGRRREGAPARGAAACGERRGRRDGGESGQRRGSSDAPAREEEGLRAASRRGGDSGSGCGEGGPRREGVAAEAGEGRRRSSGGARGTGEAGGAPAGQERQTGRVRRRLFADDWDDAGGNGEDGADWPVALPPAFWEQHHQQDEQNGGARRGERRAPPRQQRQDRRQEERGWEQERGREREREGPRAQQRREQAQLEAEGRELAAERRALKLARARSAVCLYFKGRHVKTASVRMFMFTKYGKVRTAWAVGSFALCHLGIGGLGGGLWWG